SHWAGEATIDDVNRVSEEIRDDALRTMRDAGLDSVPVNTFSWYDHVLDTSVLVGAVPPWFASEASGDQLAGFDAATYFAMARGTQQVAPLEMTKWFDTNYHYLVPEISPDTVFELHAGSMGDRWWSARSPTWRWPRLPTGPRRASPRWTGWTTSSASTPSCSASWRMPVRRGSSWTSLRRSPISTPPPRRRCGARTS